MEWKGSSERTSDGIKSEAGWNLWWHMLPVLSFLVWGALCVTDQLWYDEAFSAGLVMKPWKEMLYITAVDDHSPFYYAVLKLFYLLCGGGTNFRSLKLFSLIFMMGYMLLGKYYVDKLFGRRISVWFMSFSLLLPIMSVQAGNVRMYAMALFFYTLTGLLAMDLYRKDSNPKWILFCLSSICIVYCHTFAMIETVWLYFLFFMNLLGKMRREAGEIRLEKRRQIKKFFLCGAVVSVCFSPWLYVTFRQMQLRMKYDTESVGELAGVSALWDYMKEWFSSLETPVVPVVFMGILLAVILLGTGVIRAVRERQGSILMGAAAFFLTTLTGFIISVFLNNCFLGRYVFPGIGFVLLVYAYGMDAIQKSRIQAGIFLVAVCAFVLQYRVELKLEYDGGLARYQAFVENRVSSGDTFVGAQGHVIFLSIYYPKMQYYLNGYVPADLSFPNLNECYNIELLGQQYDKVWYITFAGDSPEGTEGKDYVVADQFHYMYYDFVIYELL